MTLSGGGFYYPARDSAECLTGRFLAQADHHAKAAERATAEKYVVMRRRLSAEATANAIAFASIDPTTLYDTGALDCRRWHRLA